MTHTPDDPHHDQRPDEAAERRTESRWRVAAAAVVALTMSVFAFVGFVLLPMAQGGQVGLDAWTAICRAIGIDAGVPSMQQPVSREQAQPVSQVAWDGGVLGRLAAGRRSGGEQLAIEVCSACHGETGVSPSPDFPNLAGQSAAAIYKQLHDYKTGARYHEQMSPVAEPLTNQQLADIAAYYAGSNQALSLGSRRLLGDEAIERLVEIGDPARGIPSCNSCHGSGVGGPIETPTLVGQHQAYLKLQLDHYATGQRRNDVYARMRTIAQRLTEEERAALAAYYQGTR